MQLKCANCFGRFFVRLCKRLAGLLTQVKRVLCSMAETYSSRACASIVRPYLKYYFENIIDVFVHNIRSVSVLREKYCALIAAERDC